MAVDAVRSDPQAKPLSSGPVAPEPRPLRGGRVHFEGNHALDEGVLRAATTAADQLSDSAGMEQKELAERYALVVTAAYYDHGYLLGSAGDPVVTRASDGSFDVVIPIVKEGPRFRIGRLTVAEVDEHHHPITPLGKIDLRKWFSAGVGDWCERQVLVSDIGKVRTHYRDQGYADADVLPETVLDEPSARVDIAITVERGPLTRIERIAVVGNRTIPSAKLRRAIPILDGDLYGESKLEDAQRQLLRSMPIRNASISTEHGSAPGRIVITFEVEEL